jgi:predicted  nucleic acid-binding Zn-ribbon protein
MEFQEFKGEKRKEIKELNQEIGKLKSDLQKNNKSIEKLDEDIEFFQEEIKNNFKTLNDMLVNEFQAIRNEIHGGNVNE